MYATALWCSTCEAVSIWLRAEDTYPALHICRRTLYYMIHDGTAHTRKLPRKLRLVCLCSLCGGRKSGSATGCDKCRENWCN